MKQNLSWERFSKSYFILLACFVVVFFSLSISLALPSVTNWATQQLAAVGIVVVAKAPLKAPTCSSELPSVFEIKASVLIPDGPDSSSEINDHHYKLWYWGYANSSSVLSFFTYSTKSKQWCNETSSLGPAISADQPNTSGLLPANIKPLTAYYWPAFSDTDISKYIVQLWGYDVGNNLRLFNFNSGLNKWVNQTQTTVDYGNTLGNYDGPGIPEWFRPITGYYVLLSNDLKNYRIHLWGTDTRNNNLTVFIYNPVTTPPTWINRTSNLVANNQVPPNFVPTAGQNIIYPNINQPANEFPNYKSYLWGYFPNSPAATVFVQSTVKGVSSPWTRNDNLIPENTTINTSEISGFFHPWQAYSFLDSRNGGFWTSKRNNFVVGNAPYHNNISYRNLNDFSGTYDRWSIVPKIKITKLTAISGANSFERWQPFSLEWETTGLDSFNHYKLILNNGNQDYVIAKNIMATTIKNVDALTSNNTAINVFIRNKENYGEQITDKAIPAGQYQLKICLASDQNICASNPMTVNLYEDSSGISRTNKVYFQTTYTYDTDGNPKITCDSALIQPATTETELPIFIDQKNSPLPTIGEDYYYISVYDNSNRLLFSSIEQYNQQNVFTTPPENFILPSIQGVNSKIVVEKNHGTPVCSIVPSVKK